MAVKRVPPFVAKLKKALIEQLDLAGIRASVFTEPIPGTKLHRVTVVAPKFARLRYSEAQDIVWRIVDRALTKDEQLLITTILTMTAAEARGKPAA